MYPIENNETFYQVRALRSVTDNGVTYPTGATFVMEQSLADAHALAGIVEVVGRIDTADTTV